MPGPTIIVDLADHGRALVQKHPQKRVSLNGAWQAAVRQHHRSRESMSKEQVLR